LNTHYHSDHTHGNPGFPAGTRVVSTTRTRALLDALDASYWSGAAAETLPNETFDTTHEIRLGGKTVRVSYLGRGHTSGDLVALSSKIASSISAICSSTTATRTSTSKPAAASSSGSARSTACWRWTATTA